MQASEPVPAVPSVPNVQSEMRRPPFKSLARLEPLKRLERLELLKPVLVERLEHFEGSDRQSGPVIGEIDVFLDGWNRMRQITELGS